MTPNIQTGKSQSWDNTSWQLNDADPGSLEVQCTGLGGGELDEDWDVLMACKKEAHVYGPSLSKQDDWNARVGTVAGTAHTTRIFATAHRHVSHRSTLLVPCF